MRFKVLSLDVWGNARDGFEKNDWWNVGTVDVPGELNARNVLRAMREAGFLKEDSQGKGRIDVHGSDPECIDVCERNGEPVYELQQIIDESEEG